ncbi:MAG: hypothetical protein M3144_09270 [Actinomycetota bacterium]|nr:hypothetical protein [Actinomycetota bacterium]
MGKIVSNFFISLDGVVESPIAVGRGQRLFEDSPTHKLQLVDHSVFQTGVLPLTYTPASD